MKLRTVVFAGGCFWCTEAVFQMVKGVVTVEPGYTGGTTESPTYEQVCTGDTGHAEALRVTFDEEVISMDDILILFFGSHDPTQLNAQGHDVGTQYRSALFYADDDERRYFEDFIEKLQALHEGEKIVTTLEPLRTFYPAEEYHASYFKRNQGAAYCQLVIEPKLSAIRESFSHLLTQTH